MSVKALLDDQSAREFGAPLHRNTFVINRVGAKANATAPAAIAADNAPVTTADTAPALAAATMAEEPMQSTSSLSQSLLSIVRKVRVVTAFVEETRYAIAWKTDVRMQK